MSANRLIYLPLGGAGEIGMNAYVYGYGPKGKERLILVDVGVAFPDMDTSPAGRASSSALRRRSTVLACFSRSSRR